MKRFALGAYDIIDTWDCHTRHSTGALRSEPRGRMKEIYPC
jgi:hypothetical protein